MLTLFVNKLDLATLGWLVSYLIFFKYLKIIVFTGLKCKFTEKLMSLNLKGTYHGKRSTRPPICAIPRQPTVYNPSFKIITFTIAINIFTVFTIINFLTLLTFSCLYIHNF